jgi:hypothetical protein
LTKERNAWAAKEREAWERFEAEKGYIRARLRLASTEEGGRRGPLVSGYRAAWHFGDFTEDGVIVLNDAPITIEGRDWLGPGGEASVRLHPLHFEFWNDARPGREIELMEGTRRVGIATVLEVVGAVPKP